MPQNIREKSLHCSVLVMTEPVLSNHPCERASVLRDNHLGGYNDGLNDRWHFLTFKTSERAPLFSRKQASCSKQVALYFEACSSVGHFLPYYSEKCSFLFLGPLYPRNQRFLGPRQPQWAPTWLWQLWAWRCFVTGDNSVYWACRHEWNDRWDVCAVQRKRGVGAGKGRLTHSRCAASESVAKLNSHMQARHDWFNPLAVSSAFCCSDSCRK